MTTYTDIPLLIGGEEKMTSPQPVTDPYTGETIGHRAHATERDVEDALQAARAAQKTWMAMGPVRREKIMADAADLLRQRADDIAYKISLEEGKTVGEAKMEIARAAANIEWDGREGRRLYGRVIPSTPEFTNIAYRRPVGVVAAFSPWNFPIASPSRKIGGALAAGCAVVLKAAEDTPAGAYELLRALIDAGAPAGVVNLLFGDPAAISEQMIPHPVTAMVTFTGSVPVGKHLSAIAGQHMKPVLMELGGHSPIFVSQTADIKATADLSVLVKSMNAGQVCVSPTRFFVEEPVFDAFVDRFAEKAAALKIGHGIAGDTNMGPLINERRLCAVDDLVQAAVADGARLVTGGQRAGNNGSAYAMTVLTDVPRHSRIMNEEPFGPVAVINRVPSVLEAIEIANSVPYGLAGYAFTQSARDIKALSEELEVGNLAVNHYSSSEPDTPFGGVKDSGIGREGGVEGPLAHTITKTVMTKL